VAADTWIENKTTVVFPASEQGSFRHRRFVGCVARGIWQNLIVSVCLITTEANAAVQPVHHRMPIIIQARFYKIWLAACEQPLERLKLCLDSEPASQMEKYRVSTLVNKPQNDTPAVIRPSGESGCQ